MIGTTVSHYTIEEELGRGGMGVVYRALDTRLDREVALKFLPRELSSNDKAKARFVREAKSASALDHPNICTIYDTGETDDGRLFIAMACYDGETLKRRLRHGALSPEDAASIALQIAQGLAAAHDAGVIHRDIKPANIMVGDDGRIRILDFGVAKLAGEADLTRDGSRVGTTSYMSPEQIRGEETDARSDLWAIGAILYEMLSGRSAFGGEYDQAVVYSVLNEEPEPLTDVPSDLEAVVTRLLEKDPEQRFHHAEGVIAALEPHAEGVSRVSNSVTTTAGTDGHHGVLKWAVFGALILATAVWAIARPFTSDTESAEESVDRNLIAVLPFSVRGGADLEYLSESMVTLLSTMLDGVGDFYTVDDNAVIEQTRNESDAAIGPEVGSKLATRFGAGHFILGNIFRAGDENRIIARLYETDGSALHEATSSYVSDSTFTRAIDRLATDLVAELMDDSDQTLSALAVRTTPSFEALRQYLRAVRLKRSGEFQEARDAVDAALRIDSTFALAWYLRGKIQGWIEPSLAYRDQEKALRHAQELTGRARRLLEAQRAFDSGRAEDAERIYRAILRDYPNDLEATGQLAEVYTHYSTHESDHRDALRLFEKASRMTPGREEFATHHSDLLAFFGKVDGDPYPLDSLAAEYAGLDSFERGDTLNWSRALDMMDPETGRHMAMHARINGSPQDSAASYLLDVADDSWRAWAYGHPRVAISTIERLGHENPSGIDFRFNHVRLSRQALGMFDRAAGEKLLLADSLNDEAARLVFDALTATLPAFQITPDSLEALYRQVSAWNAEQNPLSRYPESSDLVRAYLLAGISFRRGDRDAFQRDHASFRSLGADTTGDPVWRSVAAELRALEYWQQGDLEQAEEQMRDAHVRGVDLFEVFFNLLPLRHQPTWYLGEILELRGERQPAIEQFRAIVTRTWLAAPGWERSARLFEELGETEEAIRYYSLMIDMWRDADPDLQPRVEAARKRRDALLARSVQEPDQRIPASATE